ncbi:MAG: DUF4832 domain-containing protein [Bacteroidota bacterium]
MKRVGTFFLFYFLALGLYAQTTVNYSSTDQIIANPERGLQKYSITAGNYSTSAGANNLSVAMLNGWKNSADKVSVVFRYFLLEDFLNTDINATYLANMQGDFDNIRSAGLKVIVRFSYADQQGAGAQQPAKAQILRHINQLSSLLNTNQDVIFSQQAGFIGTWGEWYYTNSDEFGTEGNISSTQWANRKEVLDAMLAATPAGIPIQVRYAGIKTRLYGNTPLSPQTAYQNTAKARIGFYNDAFLNNWGDQGTYGVNSECQDPVGNSAYNFIANETQYLPMTGETNGLNPCNNGLRTTGDKAVQEMESTNWTTLNRDYHPDFWSQIISSNHYDEILQKLGYRFVLNTSTITENGLDFDLTLDFTNAGFARVFKERTVYLVMQNTADNRITTYPINTDIRSWEGTFSINQNINPGLEGSFQLYLWIPDQDATLATNPDYSIRLANENTWEPTTGYNDLLQMVTLSCSPTATTDVQVACESFTWQDGNTYTANNNTATYTLMGANGCDSVVTLDLTINGVSDITTMINDATITANNTNASYQWLDCGNGSGIIPGEINGSFTAIVSGNYAVEITKNACRDTSACIPILVTDILEGEKDQFQVFPNPAGDQIFVQHPIGVNGVIQIFDASGKEIIREDLEETRSVINLNKVKPGPFFVRIISDQNLITKKLIKQ